MSFLTGRTVSSNPLFKAVSPAGLGGYYPAPVAAPPPPGAPAPGLVPLGQSATQYSEVDPNWKPPEG